MSYIKCSLLWSALLLFVVLGSQRIYAQSEVSKIEIGGHISLLRDNGTAYFTPSAPTFFPPTTPLSANYDTRKNDVGLGGRIAYFATKYLSFEGEINHFFRDLPTSGGRTQYLFGPKLGRRFSKYGVFVKARPGLMRFGDGRFSFGGVDGDIRFAGKNLFAFDLGGVAEYYHTKRLYTRVDVGDTMIRPTIEQSINGGPSRTVSGINHNLQVSIGFGMRF